MNHDRIKLPRNPKDEISLFFLSIFGRQVHLSMKGLFAIKVSLDDATSVEELPSFIASFPGS